MSDDNKTNLPPHLQEKIQELAWRRAMDECHKRGLPPSGSVYGLAKEQFMSDAIQIYSLLLQELGPVVGALKLIAEPNIHVGENGWRDEHFLDVKQAGEALKHLKERILTQERTGG